MIKRKLSEELQKKINGGKVILLLGPRQTGKTTFFRHIIKNQKDSLWLNADDIEVQELFSRPSVRRFSSLFGKYKVLIVDEAQRIPNVGIAFKIIADEMKGLQLLATGSSAFELSNKMQEPLTGRKWEYRMFPISFGELADHHGIFQERQMLPIRLVYGTYPEVINNPGDERDVLVELIESYLYKDVLMIGGINRPQKIVKLLQALAFQVGSEVKYNELSRIVGLDKETVEKYIDILEKAFVVFRLTALSRNLRNEIKKTRKVYFYDNGIINALTSQFQTIELRRDVGALFENYLVSERMKANHYNKRWLNRYFWRTHTQQEIDYIEEYNGVLHTYEFKWNAHKKVKLPKSFAETYPNHTYTVISRENYDEFLM